jgi:hypothetical protein
LLELEVVKNGRNWTLSNSQLWIGNVSTFYNRECYDDLCSEIDSKAVVLITGTPGIGKTMFLQRLLVDIVDRHRNGSQGDKFPAINYITREGGNVVTYRLGENGSATLANHDSVGYVFSDSVDIEHPRGEILTLEVASHNESNYNTFFKRVLEAGERGATFAMPLCTLSELSAMCPLVTPAQCQFGYDVFGGSARNFKGMLSNNGGGFGVLAPVELISETMTWYFGKECQQDFPQPWESAFHLISWALGGKGLAQRYTVVNSLFRHRDGRGVTRWASKFMEFLASRILGLKEVSIHEEIKRIAVESGLGIMFENIAHSQLTCSDLDFDVKPLHKKTREVCAEMPSKSISANQCCVSEVLMISAPCYLGYMDFRSPRISPLLMRSFNPTCFFR